MWQKMFYFFWMKNSDFVPKFGENTRIGMKNEAQKELDTCNVHLNGLKMSSCVLWVLIKS